VLETSVEVGGPHFASTAVFVSPTRTTFPPHLRPKASIGVKKINTITTRNNLINMAHPFPVLEFKKIPISLLQEMGSFILP